MSILTKVGNLEGHEHPIYSLCISQKKHILFSGGGEGSVVEWSLKNMTPIKIMFKTNSSIYSLNCPESLPLLISGDRAGQISIFDFTQQKLLFQKKLTEKPIFGLVTAGTILYFISEDGALRTFDLVQHKIVSEVKISEDALRSIAYNADEKLLYIGSKDNRIYTYSISENRVLHSNEEHTMAVFSLAYDHERKQLLSGSRDAQIKVWQNYSSKNIAAHMYAVNSLVVAPETPYFISASMDKSIKIWDANSLALLAIGDAQRNAGHQKSVNTLAYTSFENYLISAGDDRMIMVWQVQKF